MSYTKAELLTIIDLCNQVRTLANDVIEEANRVSRWDVEKREYTVAPQWPYYGGTKTTGELRRRSLDLTRALAELRRP